MENALSKSAEPDSASQKVIALKNQLTHRSKPYLTKARTFIQQNLLGKQAGQWFTGMVLVPLLLSTVYLSFMASDRYVSKATFMIERSDGGGGMIEGFNLFGISPQTGNDLKILESYIQSPDMLNYLQDTLDLRQHYHDKADWLSGLGSSASYDDFLSFYREHLGIRFNDSTGLLELSVQAFTPEMAEKIANAVLHHSEVFVNQISHSLANDQKAFVEKEVRQNEGRLKEATAQVVEFQNKYGLLNASEQSVALSTVLNDLQAELIKKRTELQTLTSYMNSDAPEIITLKQRIKALEKQLGTEQKRLTSTDKTSMNNLTAHQNELQLNVELATKAYTSALVALETTRTEASRKLKQLVVVSTPYKAEDATYPRVLYSLTNIFLVLLMIFGLVRMVYASVMEHRD